jgi:hypothetical protein
MNIFKLEDINFKIDYKDYKRFLNNDIQSIKCWYGVSMQVDGRYKDSRKYQLLNKIFNHLIDDLDLNIDWYILQSGKIKEWFYYDDWSTNFPLIKQALHNSGLSSKSKGVIKCNTKEFVELFPEIIRYPSELSLQDIDCINDTENIIIKSTHHYDIDLISMETKVLNSFIDKVKSLKDLRIIKYNTLH